MRLKSRVMKILSAEESTILDNELIKNKIIKTINILGQETINKNQILIEIFEDGKVKKKLTIN